MIKTFMHKGLRRLYETGSRGSVQAAHAARLERLLDRLAAATLATDMNLPGFGFHELAGNRKGTYAVKVSGNWRLTFRFQDGDACNVDLEDYH